MSTISVQRPFYFSRRENLQNLDNLLQYSFVKSKNIYLLSLGLFFIFCGLIAWILFPYLVKEEVSYSPLPPFLSLTNNKQTSTLDLWLPKLVDVFFPEKLKIPQITAQSGLMFDIDSQKVLFGKEPNKRLPMASLTKVMTAVVALEHKKTNDEYLVNQQDLVGENSMGLTSGEILNLDELLYGLMLASGNDAAETIASNFEGGRSSFIVAMNDKAKSLGLTNTHFTNPTGLEGDGNQYTTVYDLMVITQFALAHFAEFKQIVSTFDYDIPYSDKHKEFYLENETNLISSYPGVKGVKDGYTPEAGLCLITYLDYKDKHFIGVILGSENRRDEMKELLDYGLKLEGITPPPHG